MFRYVFKAGFVVLVRFKSPVGGVKDGQRGAFARRKIAKTSEKSRKKSHCPFFDNIFAHFCNNCFLNHIVFFLYAIKIAVKQNLVPFFF